MAGTLFGLFLNAILLFRPLAFKFIVDFSVLLEEANLARQRTGHPRRATYFNIVEVALDGRFLTGILDVSTYVLLHKFGELTNHPQRFTAPANH
jgi:hypothetical protein